MGVSFSDTTKSGNRVWYDEVIECNASLCDEQAAWRRPFFRRITVATNMPTRQEAEDLTARLRRELRLPEGAVGKPPTTL